MNKKFLSILLVIAIFFTSSIGVFAYEKNIENLKIGNQNVQINILKDDANERIVEAIDGETKTIATYDKLTKKVHTTTVKIGIIGRNLNSVTDEDIIDLGEDIDESVIELNESFNSRQALNESFNSRQAKKYDAGYSSAATMLSSDHAYYGYGSSAAIYCGEARPRLRISASDFEDSSVQRWYEGFTAKIDDIITLEGGAAIATITALTSVMVKLLALPDLTLSKLAALLAAVGVTGAAIGFAWQWYRHARGADDYYDKIKKRI